MSTTKNAQGSPYELKVRVRLPIEGESLDTELVFDDTKVVRFLGLDLGKREFTDTDAEQFGEEVYKQIIKKRMTPA